jgi:DNA polymerase-3 subunit alpha
MNQIEPLIAKAKQFNMPAIAMTDHGNLFGAIEFYQAAKKAGIKPIIGCEVYLAPKSRFDKEGSSTHEDDYTEGGGSNPYYHLILLAADELGYKNLIKLISIANIEGFYYKPRIDKEILQKYSAGLIGLSGCLRGEIPYLLNLGYEKEAEAAAGTYQEIFGKDRFYIEIQNNGLEIQNTVNRKLIPLAQRNGIPIVATNDCHYLHKDDVRAHDIMLCIQTGKTVNAQNRMRFGTDQLYFKSSEEMVASFAEIPEAVKNTLRIADQIDLNLKFGELHLPHYEPPKGVTREDYLKRLAEEGLSRRLKEKAKRPLREGSFSQRDYEDRLASELAVIHKVGYAGYFLIVWDILNHARTAGIPIGPGRGSAAGSLVSFALGITNLDPIPYGLLFERFLNSERVSPPDIDMDISMDHRDELLSYVTEKFGKDHVCQIITFGTMAAKAAIRDVGRALEIPYGEVDKIAKLVPNILNITLDEAIAQEPKLKQLSEDPARSELLILAKKMEGLARHASTHAAGVVISAKPLTDYLPLYRGKDGEIITQYAMADVEKVGLVKFDFLGLRTLTVIDHACRLIIEKEPCFNLTEIPMDDAETYLYLSSGETIGLFQLESSGMRDLIMKAKPTLFEDIIALLALYRPGPLGSGMVDDFVRGKKGKTKISYELPQLEPILKETYGVILYQEQVMKIANVLALFSLGEADLLRRAMGKKKVDEMAAQKSLFITRAVGNGIPEKKAEKIFDLMEKFAGYGFNKSHSAAYALITFQTAYLKCHFPYQFMAALLTSEKGNSDKIVRYITECRRMGILILPPHINESERDFTVTDSGIRFGLAAIKNVGSTAVDAMIATRAEQGHFKSLLHFCQKVPTRKANKRVIEGLIKSGAFDFTKGNRHTLIENLEQVMEAGEKTQKSEKANQISMFGDDSSPLEGEVRWGVGEGEANDSESADEIARMEKESLGFYITAHPLARYEALMKEHRAIPTEALENQEESERAVCVCGIVTEEKVVQTKKGDKMAYLRLEDLTGSVEVIVFPDLYRVAAPIIKQEKPLLITGTLDKTEHGMKFKALTCRLLDGTLPKAVSSRLSGGSTLAGHGAPAGHVAPAEQAKTKSSLIISLPDNTAPSIMNNLKEILSGFPGDIPVYLHVELPERSVMIDTKTTVLASPLMMAKIEILVGSGKAELR